MLAPTNSTATPDSAAVLAIALASSETALAAAIAGLGLALLGGLYGWWWRRRRRRRGASQALPLGQAVQRFAQARPHLGEMLRQAAARSGKPRGLVWEQCELGERVVFACQQANPTLWALVEVIVHFSAVPGGDMEGVAAVAEPRQATAVFVCTDEQWISEGRVLFNLTPAEAIARLGLVEQIAAASSESD